MKEKVVLYVGGFELPDKNAAAQRVVSNAKILKALGYSVVFVGIDKSIKKKCKIDTTESEIFGFKSFRIKYPESIIEWVNYLLGIGYLFDLLKLKPSIIIAYNYPSIALFQLNKILKRKGISLISDCTEWYEPTGNILFRIIKGLDVYLRMKIIHPKLDGLIAISKYLYDYYSIRMDNVILIPPLVDKKQIESNEKEEITLENKEIKLIYAGSVGTGKKDRLDKIIDSLSIVYNKYSVSFNFVVIGLTLDQYCKIYSTFGLPLNIKDRIIFKGRLSHNEALLAVCNSDFEIFLREKSLANTAGFPTKFVEAISCGIPVLTNLSTNLDLYLKNDYNGYILDNSSVACLVDSLAIPLTKDRQSINTLKYNCDKCDFFDYRNYVEKFHLFLSSLENCVK